MNFQGSENKLEDITKENGDIDHDKLSELSFDGKLNVAIDMITDINRTLDKAVKQEPTSFSTFHLHLSLISL